MIIAGVDEVGRGCIAGPVVAAAVICGTTEIQGLNDSKKLSPSRRKQLYEAIVNSDWQFSIAEASVDEIDRLNILNASLLAMDRAIEKLTCRPQKVLVDGNKVPPRHALISQAIIGGDATIIEIQAASVMAKVFRDRMMERLDSLYPHYGLKNHKGYPTKAHLTAISEYGITDFYRKSFAPVAKLIH